ncbi:hypothetical protein [Nocardia sp. IFM 10818]
MAAHTIPVDGSDQFALIDATVQIAALAEALSIPNGAFLVEPTTGRDIRNGYAVFTYPEYERTIESPATPVDIFRYILDMREHLPYCALAGWRNPHTGKTHLGIAVVSYDLANAMHLARRHQQRQIIDLGAQSVIPVSYLAIR